MKSAYTIDDAGWNTLIQNVAYYFDDLTLKRGFQYFKQGRVIQFSMSAPPFLEAVVEGREEYRVQINLEAISLSHCSCPVQGHCKHMAAVLLNFADWQNRSVPALVNAKNAAQAVLAGRSSAPAESRTSGSRAAAQDSLRDAAGRIPSMGIQEWHEWFEHRIAPLAQQVRNPQYVEAALSLIFKAKPQLSPVAGQLFRLHAQLFLLETLIKPARNPRLTFAASSMGYYTHLAASELQLGIEQSFGKELPLDTEPEQWVRVRETLTYLRNEMLKETREAAYFSICYELLWKQWLIPASRDTALFMEELEQLQLAEETMGALLSRYPWLLAQSRMHFRLSEDREAWELLKSAAERPDFRAEDLMGFLAALSEAGDWARLVDWLVQAGTLLSRRRFKLEKYALYWEKAVEELPGAEPQMWDTLVEMLPSSRDIYDEKLLAYSKWQEWMDYQLSAGREPAMFRVTKLQPLEKHAPETLLPFYHQAVERYIAEKNRSSYKAAVKLLKRLQKLYKKMKQEERWQSFLHGFTVRHSRLRALQEELRKGKLTHE